MPVAVLLLVLPAVRAGFEFGVELLRFLATAEGQQMVGQWRSDDKALRAAAKQIGAWIQKLFLGQIIKFDAGKLVKTAEKP